MAMKVFIWLTRSFAWISLQSPSPGFSLTAFGKIAALVFLRGELVGVTRGLGHRAFVVQALLIQTWATA